MQTHTSCAILAGGNGSRLGGVPKGLIEIGSETLVERLVRQLRPHCADIRIIANQPHLYEFLGLLTHRDDMPGRGPLEGIATALRRIRGERVLVVACDMPLVTPESLETLVNWPRGADAVVPRSAKGLEPLFALYARSALPVIEAALADGERKIRALFDRLHVETPPLEVFEASLWHNVNEHGDLARLSEFTGQPASLPRSLPR